MIAYQPITQVHNCSFKVTPDTQWNREWFKENSTFEKSKRTLEKIKFQYGIKEPRNWGDLTRTQIAQAAGKFFLKQYRNSLYECLKSIHPGI